MKYFILTMFFVFAYVANSSAQKCDLNEIEHYLNDILTLKADFKQYSGEDVSKGRLYLSHNKMKWEYFSPKNLLVIASKRQVIYYDPKLEEVTYIPASKVPGMFLIREGVSFNKNIKVLSCSIIKDDIVLKVQDKDMEKTQTTIKMFLKASPMSLKGFIIENKVQDTDVEIKLSSLEVNTTILKEIFVFKDPNFFKTRN